MNVTNKSFHTDNTRSLMLPCLAPTGSKIFAPTADQRFLAGATEFLRTHFPVKLNQRGPNRPITLTEDDLLYDLLNPDDSTVGNRVFVLYGAAGSGKSELLRWLQTQTTMHNSKRAAIMTRITRTELDIFHLVQRLQHLYNTQSFQNTTLQRWEEARQKPRTLAKLLVLTALEQLLNSDDQINALYYQLIDVVQTNLERCFASMTKPTEDIGQFVELFSREDLTDILRNSVIPVLIEYETLRHHILKAFRDHLLEGLDLPRLLKQIAQKVQEEHGQRPILLVDDLVQSINLFATDLLDYFITLEDGCWDVVVGITPNSLESTLRGKELLDRIAFLDTIDDRVQKLWLSDEYGLSSSFLNETNCTEYARLYLSEYKRQNLQPCNKTCSSFRKCSELELARHSDVLAPFNKELLIRLFRSLPPGKGKVRYFTLYLRDILQRITRGENLLSVLQQHVRSELAVYHADNRVAQVYEMYGPIVTKETVQDNTEDITHIYNFFDIISSAEYPQQPIIASLHRNNDGVTKDFQPSEETPLVIDPGKETIKAWLRGEVVNKQLLRDVRRGVVKAIKDGYMLDIMTRLYIAKPFRILRWTQTRLDTMPPVQLEKVDDFDGLPIPQAINSLAYTLYDFADATGWAEQKLRSELLSHEAFPFMMFEANSYRQKIRSELEKQLGMKVDEFAFSLLVFATFLGRFPVELPSSLKERIVEAQEQTSKYPENLESERPRLAGSSTVAIRRLFEDSFKLRENVFDGLLLEKMANEISLMRAFDLLQRIDHENIHADFRLNDEPLGTFVSGIQDKILTLIQLKSSQQARTAFMQVCQNAVEMNDIPKLLVASLKETNGDIERGISNFITACHPCELHLALVEVAAIETAHYERSLEQLREMLLELDALQETSKIEGKNSAKHFTKAEADVLIQFTQQDFRMPVEQLELGLLTKIAHQLPELYKRLEVRVQRG